MISKKSLIKTVFVKSIYVICLSGGPCWKNILSRCKKSFYIFLRDAAIKCMYEIPVLRSRFVHG